MHVELPCLEKVQINQRKTFRNDDEISRDLLAQTKRNDMIELAVMHSHCIITNHI